MPQQIDIFPFALFNPVSLKNSGDEEGADENNSIDSDKIVRKIGRRVRRRVRTESVGFDKIDRNEEFEVITDNLVTSGKESRKLVTIIS